MSPLRSTVAVASGRQLGLSMRLIAHSSAPASSGQLVEGDDVAVAGRSGSGRRVPAYGKSLRLTYQCSPVYSIGCGGARPTCSGQKMQTPRASSSLHVGALLVACGRRRGRRGSVTLVGAEPERVAVLVVGVARLDAAPRRRQLREERVARRPRRRSRSRRRGRRAAAPRRRSRRRRSRSSRPRQAAERGAEVGEDLGALGARSAGSRAEHEVAPVRQRPEARPGATRTSCGPSRPRAAGRQLAEALQVGGQVPGQAAVAADHAGCGVGDDAGDHVSTGMPLDARGAGRSRSARSARRGSRGCR